MWDYGGENQPQLEMLYWSALYTGYDLLYWSCAPFLGQC